MAFILLREAFTTRADVKMKSIGGIAASSLYVARGITSSQAACLRLC